MTNDELNKMWLETDLNVVRKLLDKWWDANVRNVRSAQYGTAVVHLLSPNGKELLSEYLTDLQTPIRFNLVRTYTGYRLTHGFHPPNSIDYKLRRELGMHFNAFHKTVGYDNCRYLFVHKLGEKLVGHVSRSWVGAFDVTHDDMEDLVHVLTTKDQLDALTLQLELGG